MEEPAIVVPHLVIAIYIPLLSLRLHKLFGRYMLNTSILWSRKDQRPWILTTDLSIFFCLFPGLYLLPPFDLQAKPRKPTKISVL